MENDRRTKRTKKLLTKAFIELLSKKKLNDITVKELCLKADINRGTFYLHYQDIYDLKQQIENELYQNLNSIVDTLPSTMNASNTYRLLLDLFCFIKENSELLKVFLGTNGDISFQKRMQTIFKERYLDYLLQDKSSDNLIHIDYSYNFIASGFTGLVETWLNEENPPSAEEMARLTNKLLFDGLPSLFSIL